MLNIAIDSSQKVLVTAAPVDANGAPAQLDGPISFATESGDATVEFDDTNPMAFFVVSGAAGDSVIRVSADADLGGGSRTIEDTINVTVTQAIDQANDLGLTVGDPVAK